MNGLPDRLADLLPGVVADLTARHHATNGAPMATPLICDTCNDPMEDTEVGVYGVGVVLCQACTDDAEPADGAA